MLDEVKTTEGATNALALLEERHKKWLDKYAKTKSKYLKVISGLQEAKFKAGDAVFHKTHGNCIVKSTKYNNNCTILYACVGVFPNTMYFQEADIEPITVANQVLYRK